MHSLTKKFLSFKALGNSFKLKTIKIANVNFNSHNKLNNHKVTIILTIMLVLLISVSLLNYSYLEELNKYIHLIENPLPRIDSSNSSELTKPDESIKSIKSNESIKSAKSNGVDNPNDTEDASDFWGRFDFEEFDDSCEYYELTDFLVV